MKTQLEQILTQTEEQIKRSNLKEQIENKKQTIDKNYNKHVAEFNKIYTNIESIEQRKNILIEWTNKQEIYDATYDTKNKIKNGQDMYQDLLQRAHKNYHTYRMEGYTQITAFDKSTQTIIEYMQKSLTIKEKLTIYINISPAFKHRLRHMME